MTESKQFKPKLSKETMRSSLLGDLKKELAESLIVVDELQAENAGLYHRDMINTINIICLEGLIQNMIDQGASADDFEMEEGDIVAGLVRHGLDEDLAWSVMEQIKQEEIEEQENNE